MKGICSGGASRNGSRGIFASLFERFLDLAFLIEEPVNPRHNLALSLQTEDHSRKSHRTEVALFFSLNCKPPLPSREGVGVRGNSFPRMLEVNPGIYDLAIFKSV